MKTRAEYLAIRHQYMPDPAQLIILAESPPIRGLYFYDRSGSVGEPLFVAAMKQIGFKAKEKEVGLREFQKRGLILVDATYQPINNMREKQRADVIIRDYPLLFQDLERISPLKNTPIVLIKKNVCYLLEERLRVDGFPVINNRNAVYFPSTGHQRSFHFQFRAIIQAASLDIKKTI